MAKGKVSDAVIEDHRELEHYYNNIMNAKDADTKERWQNQFVWELARHSIAEELVVYPEFEKNLPNGHDMAEKDRGDHRAVSPLHLSLRIDVRLHARSHTPSSANLSSCRSRKSSTSSRS